VTMPPEHAEAIARGDAEFTPADNGPEIEALWRVIATLRRTVILLGVTAAVAVAALVAFSVFRGWERRSFDVSINELAEDAKSARLRADELARDLSAANVALECRAESNFRTDQALAVLLAVVADEFASALDRTPPDPDNVRIATAADQLEVALAEREASLQSCAASD
jgi:hypothetical protein